MTNPFYGYILHEECIDSCAMMGAVDEAVDYWTKEYKLATDFPRGTAIIYLVSTGGWSIAELRALDDHELAMKCLWLECCDRRENPTHYESVVSEVIDTIDIPVVTA